MNKFSESLPAINSKIKVTTFHSNQEFVGVFRKDPSSEKSLYFLHDAGLQSAFPKESHKPFDEFVLTKSDEWSYCFD